MVGLMGGHMSPDVAVASDVAIYDELARAAAYGHVLVLTADSLCEGDDWLIYLPFLRSNLSHTPLSVRSICFAERAASFDERTVLSAARNASFVFATGGDQARYYDFWHDAPLAKLLSQRLAADASSPLVFAGSSAGLAIQSPTVFAALNGSVTSDDALQRPFEPSITLRPSPFAFACNGDRASNALIFDTHFKQRNRMGRLTTFVNRMHARNGNDAPTIGVGVSEKTAVLIDVARNCTARVAGVGPVNAIVVRRRARVLAAHLPLSAPPAAAHRAMPSETFDFNRGAFNTSHSYELVVKRGRIFSLNNEGSLY